MFGRTIGKNGIVHILHRLGVQIQILFPARRTETAVEGPIALAQRSTAIQGLR